jgi:hypothetical protein
MRTVGGQRRRNGGRAKAEALAAPVAAIVTRRPFIVLPVASAEASGLCLVDWQPASTSETAGTRLKSELPAECEIPVTLPFCEVGVQCYGTRGSHSALAQPPPLVQSDGSRAPQPYVPLTIRIDFGRCGSAAPE